MPLSLQHEMQDFLATRQVSQLQAAQTAALQILCGLDFEKLLKGTQQLRDAAANKLARLIERERLKGLNKHWSYDLNRHIALKQARDRLLNPTL